MRLLPACLSLLLFAGCAAQTLGERDRDEMPDGDECIDSRDCVAGLVCERGLCLPPGEDPPTGRRDCETAEDCPEDYTCEDRGTVRICIPPPAPGAVSGAARLAGAHRVKGEASRRLGPKAPLRRRVRKI